MVQLIFTMMAVLLGSQLVQAQAFCVNIEKANLYSKPEAKTESLQANRYTPLQGTGKEKAGWVEVKDCRNRVFWTRTKSLTTKYRCVAMRVKSPRLTAGPGSNFDGPVNIKDAEKYEGFRDLGGEDGWTQIQNSKGGRAWVSLDQIWRPTGGKFKVSFDRGH